MPILRTLGGLSLSRGGDPILPRRRKELVLLVYLARRSPRWVSRGELSNLLWGDRDESRARHSLRQAVSELRGELGETLEIDADALRTSPGGLELDVQDFELAVQEGREADALKLWRGEFLAGCEDLGLEELRTWIETERAGLRKQLGWASRRVVDRARAAGDWKAAIAAATAWCDALPWDEKAHLVAIETLQAAGRTAEAAARHAEFLERAARDLGSPPSERFARLAESLASQSRPAAFGERGLLTPDLIGRTEALGRLDHAWHAAKEGAVAVVLGEEGAGKTRLCREFVQIIRARPDRATAVECRAFEAERERPWALVRPLLLAIADAPGFRAAPASTLASAAGIAPEIRERMPQLSPATPDTSPVESVLRLCREVAAEAPLLLIIDEVTSTDSHSLEVVSALVRRPPPGCLLVLTGEPDSLQRHPLEVDLRQASGHVARITLNPLDESDVELMVASMMPIASGASRVLAGELLRASSGNPGQIQLLVFGWVDAGLLAPGPDGLWMITRPLDGVPLPVPSDIRQAIAARLGRMSPAARAAAEAAAIFEGEIELELLEHTAGVSGNRFGPALGELLSHRILRESSRRPGSYEFPGEPARRAVLDAMAPSGRRRLHRRAATGIRQLRPATAERAERLAYHNRLGRSPVFRRRSLWFGAAASLAALVLLATLLRRGGAELGQGGQIVLADVHNASTDSTLGRAFYTAATVGLQGSRHLSLFPRNRVRETLARMGRVGADSMLTEPLAREVAVREGLSMVVALGVTQVDTTYLLSARLIDPETGRDVDATSLRVSGRAGLLEGIDRLLGRTRKALGESSRELRANSEPLPRITTSSLDALRAYVAGSEAWSRRDMSAAREHWERAIRLDSTFALALAALADVWYLGYNDRVTGDRWMNRALGQLGRLTERERLRILSQGAQRQGRASAAVDYALMLAERYPTRDTWYNHGTVLMGQYRCREAIPSIRKSLTFDSLFTNGHLNLATCLQLEGTAEEALAEYAAAGRSDSLALYRANINHEWGTALVRAGRPAQAESAYVRMAEAGRAPDRARGFRSLAWLEMYRGRFRRAALHLLDAINLSGTGSPNVSVFRNQVILAQVQLTLGDTARARRTLAAATAGAAGLELEPGFLAYLGHAQLRAGLTGAAQKTFATLSAKVIPTNSNDRAIRQGLESHLLLAEGDGAGALAAAQPVYDPRQAAFRLSALAGAYAAQQQVDSALAVAVRLSNTFAFGEEPQFEWLRGPLLVARLAEAKGDSATARAAYGRFIAQWSSGDPDLPELRFARRALARLQVGNR